MYPIIFSCDLIRFYWLKFWRWSWDHGIHPNSLTELHLVEIALAASCLSFLALPQGWLSQLGRISRHQLAITLADSPQFDNARSYYCPPDYLYLGQHSRLFRSSNHSWLLVCEPFGWYTWPLVTSRLLSQCLAIGYQVYIRYLCQ